MAPVARPERGLLGPMRLILQGAAGGILLAARLAEVFVDMLAQGCTPQAYLVMMDVRVCLCRCSMEVLAQVRRGVAHGHVMMQGCSGSEGG